MSVSVLSCGVIRGFSIPRWSVSIGHVALTTHGDHAGLVLASTSRIARTEEEYLLLLGHVFPE